MKHGAIAVLINYLKPPAGSRVIEEVAMGIVGKHVARTKAIANQGTWIFFLPERNAIVKLRECRIPVVEIRWIQSRDVSVGGVEIKQSRKVVPVCVENDLARRQIR